MPLDIKETTDSYHVIADLPGLTKEGVKISIHDNNVLLIEAERKYENKVEGHKYHREERSSGYVSRSIILPDNADHDKIVAKFENGVLTLNIEKKPAEHVIEKTRTIEVQ
eukprot:gene18647-24388_t